MLTCSKRPRNYEEAKKVSTCVNLVLWPSECLLAIALQKSVCCAHCPHCCYSSLSSSPTQYVLAHLQTHEVVFVEQNYRYWLLCSPFLVTHTYIATLVRSYSALWHVCRVCYSTIANWRITLLLRPLLEGAVQAPRPTRSAGCTGKAPARTTWVSSDRGIGSEAFPTHT